MTSGFLGGGFQLFFNFQSLGKNQLSLIFSQLGWNRHLVLICCASFGLAKEGVCFCFSFSGLLVLGFNEQLGGFLDDQKNHRNYQISSKLNHSYSSSKLFICSLNQPFWI